MTGSEGSRNSLFDVDGVGGLTGITGDGFASDEPASMLPLPLLWILFPAPLLAVEQTLAPESGNLVTPWDPLEPDTEEEVAPLNDTRLDCIMVLRG